MILKAVSNLRDDLVNIKNKALEARREINVVIAEIDKFISTTNTQDMIIHLRQNGCSYNQIADLTGLSYTAVHKRCKKLEAEGKI